MKEIQFCPKCSNPMKNLGNISGIVLTSYPSQWDEVHVCYKCETKRTVREHGKKLGVWSYGINDFKEV